MTEPTIPAGATPAAGGATPPQSPPAPPAADTPPAAPTAPATGEPDALGDAGKRAIDAMKAERNAAQTAAKAAQKELEDLKLASASDHDKAIAVARKEAEDAVRTSGHAAIRREAVRGALATAGINPSVVDLAVHATEFAGLKVDDSWAVEGLDDAVKAFRASKPDLFKAPVAAGTADGGARGGGKTIARDQLKNMTPDEINAAFDRGDLTGLLKPG